MILSDTGSSADDRHRAKVRLRTNVFLLRLRRSILHACNSTTMNAWIIYAVVAFGLVSASTLKSDLFAPSQVQLEIETDSLPVTNTGKVIDAEVSRFIQDTMEASKIKGASLAFVRANGEVELGAWGIRSEDGDPMTTDVSIFLLGALRS